MDIDVQQFSSFEGFADDSQYANLFGGSRAANRINAETDKVLANIEQSKNQANAQSQQFAQQFQQSMVATEEALKQADLIKKQLEEAKTSKPTISDIQPTSSGMNKTVLIGGGIVVLGIITILILKK